MALDLYWKKRDFGTTPEPRGKVDRKKKDALKFVIQKHRASHLHYDFRLELDGVLLSWAVPKGPSLDPSIKRLAMHVEDHPLEYGEFEGVIPPKQYGSGTVMLWDRGTWESETDDPRGDYKRGRLKLRLHGEKLHGSWALVRTWDKDGDGRRWLLLKHDDEYATPESERIIVEDEDRSVVTGRDLDEIAAQADAVWDSHKSVAANVKAGAVPKRATVGKRAPPAKKSVAKKTGSGKTPLAKVEGARKAAMPETLGAQLCTLVRDVPRGDEWVHEIKYDGYRMLSRIDRGRVEIISRNGKEWTAHLGPVAEALKALPVERAWLDGEVVVVLPDGRTSFQELQLALGASPEQLKYYAFDLLYLDGYDLRELPLIERKQLLRRLIPTRSKILHYSDHFDGDGAKFLEEGCRRQLEGVVSKRRDATYHATRGGSWVKTKCSLRQEMVIGGWTEPSGSRAAFGALLLGAYEGKKLRYAGRVGTGFDTKALVDIHRRLRALATKEPPFDNPPRGADARGAHWVKPQLVGEIEFTEWTRDGTARHPSFKGLRLDKKASEVVIEKPAEEADVAKPKRKATVGGASFKTAGSHPYGHDLALQAREGAERAASSCAGHDQQPRQDPLSRSENHEARGRGVLPRDRRVDAAVPRGPPADARALPDRLQGAVLLPEACQARHVGAADSRAGARGRGIRDVHVG